MERTITKKVVRYSDQGFKPQKQTHHMEYINYHLHDFDISVFPTSMRANVSRIHNQRTLFYKQHLLDLKYGVWCFIDGYEDDMSLNHLSTKVKRWEAELPCDTECYDCNWERFTTISDPCVLCGGCYIPKRELFKLQNIKFIDK